MTNKEITTYLNDHLAGSVAAMELLDHLIEHYQGQLLEGIFCRPSRRDQSRPGCSREVAPRRRGNRERISPARSMGRRKICPREVQDCGPAPRWASDCCRRSSCSTSEFAGNNCFGARWPSPTGSNFGTSISSSWSSARSTNSAASNSNVSPRPARRLGSKKISRAPAPGTHRLCRSWGV